MSDGNNITIDVDQSDYLRAKIKVVGVGGGGCNAIKNMIDGNLKGVELIAANTDAQALSDNPAKIKIQLGKRTTKGLGAGADPEVGRKAAEESEQEIKEIVANSEMVFVTCGMGGGTGTGASPIVARIAKEEGALVVGIVTRPFDFEGKIRIENSKKGIEELRKNVDAIIVIPNQKIYDIIDDDIETDEALKKIDEILFNSTRGISDIINNPGQINVDFADVRTIMKDKGDALMGIGYASGDNRAKEAAIKAINSPLLDGISIAGAKGLLINITSGKSVRMKEVQTIIKTIQEYTGEDVNLIHGIVKNNEDTDILSVTVVAAGFDNSNTKKITNETKGQVPIFEEVNDHTSKQKTQQSFPFNFNKNPNKGFPIAKSAEKATSVSLQPLQQTEIPRGNDLKKFDQPAILRNEAFVKPVQNNITTFPDDSNQVEVKPESLQESESYSHTMPFENTPRGVDFINLQKNDNNYIQRFML
jgi:cell division protein FtsZ